MMGASDLPIGGGFTAQDASVQFSNGGITLHADVNGLFGTVQAHLDGWVNWQGQFDLSVTSDFDLGPITGKATFDLNDFNGGVTLTAGLSGGFDYSTDGCGVSGSMTASVTVTVDGSGLHYSGSGSASGSVDTPLGSLSIDSGTFSVSDGGFTIPLPGPVPNIDVSW
jgi:hypothetical protein